MESLHHRRATAPTRRSPAPAETFTAWRPTCARPPRRTRPGCCRPRIAMSREVRGAQEPRGFRRFVPRANTRALHPEPRLSSGGDVGISLTGRTCEHLRSHARTLDASGAVIPYKAERELPATTHLRAGARARPIPDPLPACLRPLPIERRNTIFIRRERGPQRHAPADHATVDSRSRRSANTRGVTVGSIRTVITRDSHHHRVPSPCTEYYRALAGQRAALGFRAAPAT